MCGWSRCLQRRASCIPYSEQVLRNPRSVHLTERRLIVFHDTFLTSTVEVVLWATGVPVRVLLNSSYSLLCRVSDPETQGTTRVRRQRSVVLRAHLLVSASCSGCQALAIACASELDDQVAILHLSAHGTELNVFTREHAVSRGAKVESPFPAHCLYSGTIRPTGVKVEGPVRDLH